MRAAVACIPTYNERENLKAITEAVLASDPRLEVLIVDDSSPDGTGDLADRLAVVDKRVHVLHRAQKQGLGRAYLDAFRWALSRQYQYVLEMDADFSHHPKYLPQLLNEAERGTDLVLGSRYVPGGGTLNWGRVSRLGRSPQQRLRVPDRADLPRAPKGLSSEGSSDCVRGSPGRPIEDEQNHFLRSPDDGLEASLYCLGHDLVRIPDPLCSGASRGLLRRRSIRRGANFLGDDRRRPTAEGPRDGVAGLPGRGRSAAVFRHLRWFCVQSTGSHAQRIQGSGRNSTFDHLARHASRATLPNQDLWTGAIRGHVEGRRGNCSVGDTTVGRSRVDRNRHGAGVQRTRDCVWDFCLDFNRADIHRELPDPPGSCSRSAGSQTFRSCNSRAPVWIDPGRDCGSVHGRGHAGSPSSLTPSPIVPLSSDFCELPTPKSVTPCRWARA